MDFPWIFPSLPIQNAGNLPKLQVPRAIPRPATRLAPPAPQWLPALVNDVGHGRSLRPGARDPSKLSMDLRTRNGDLMVNNGESWDDMGFTLW